MNFFLIFHHNLAFSSIPTEHYTYVIEYVYEKLLDIAESGIPLGLEYTGETLETIQKLKPDFIDRLKVLVRSNGAELIGSSYSQAIFPLIPAKVNRWNLEYGIETYEKILGTRPKIAFLNEQCYSDSLPYLYKDYGYEALILDWMNARKDNEWPEAWRYHPLIHGPTRLFFLWSDCISFQKFQRTVWGELDEKEWEDFVAVHKKMASRHPFQHPIFSLYASDAEVFDYRPGNLETLTAVKGHFKKIKRMLNFLIERKGESVLLPTQALTKARIASLPEIERVCTPSYPIRTKKQDKYNVTRWAVTGRASSRMNTQCFKLLSAIEKMEVEGHGEERLNFLKKELVRLWGSDFRTHTTDEKIENFRNRMGAALFWAQKENGCIPRAIDDNNCSYNLSHLIKENGRKIHIEKNGIRLTVLKNRGLAIEEFAFEKCGTKPLLGTIAHGYFSDISLGSDFYTGHIMLLTQDGRQYTDLSANVSEVEVRSFNNSVMIRNKIPMELPGLLIYKSLVLDEDSFKIIYDMYAKDLRPASLRLGIFTLLPESFKKESLFFETFNGGEQRERFSLKNTKVLQDSPVNHIVTCRHCLGNVTGQLTIGDDTKYLNITTNLSELYSVPLLHYEELMDSNSKESFFLRVYHTICERDDVANVFWKGKMSISFEITATKVNSNN